MAANITIRKKRLRQLYAQGVTMSQIAERFRISHQAVSKALDRKTAAAGLQQQHVAHRDLDKKLRAGENRQRMRKRAQEWFAQGLRIAFVVERLGLPRQAVIEMKEGDAEIKRLHTARVALDKKLIAGEPVTEADFAVGQVAPRPDGNRRRDASGDDRGEPTPSRAQAAVREDAESATDGHSESATAKRPETQPPGAAESATAERPKTQPPGAAESATSERPEVQPPGAAESATQKAKPTSSPQSDLQRASPTPPAPPSQRPDSEKAKIAAAKRKVELVRKHVRAYEPPYKPPYEPHYGRAYEYFPAYTPEEARQVTMYIARIVTGLSYLDLAEVFDCDYSTIHSACDKVVALYAVLAPARDRIVRIEHEIRGSTPARAPAATKPPPRSIPEWVAAPL